MKQWLNEGKRVKIMTARASITDGEIYAENILAINGAANTSAWSSRYAMTQLWDDRAVSVIKNTGIALVLDG